MMCYQMLYVTVYIISCKLRESDQIWNSQSIIPIFPFHYDLST
jgi:hypothetical protein